MRPFSPSASYSIRRNAPLAGPLPVGVVRITRQLPVAVVAAPNRSGERREPQNSLLLHHPLRHSPANPRRSRRRRRRNAPLRPTRPFRGRPSSKMRLRRCRRDSRRHSSRGSPSSRAHRHPLRSRCPRRRHAARRLQHRGYGPTLPSPLDRHRPQRPHPDSAPGVRDDAGSAPPPPAAIISGTPCADTLWSAAALPPVLEVDGGVFNHSCVEGLTGGDPIDCLDRRSATALAHCIRPRRPSGVSSIPQSFTTMKGQPCGTVRKGPSLGIIHVGQSSPAREMPLRA